MKQIFSKKSISPVVAIALLLVVAVSAVVGFQAFFKNYQSQIFTDVEQKSIVQEIAQIQDLIGNSLYIKNNGKNLTILEIKIGKNSCNLSNSNLSLGISEIKIKNCIKKTGVENVMILTNKGVLEKKFFIENGNFKENSQSNPSQNPTNQNCNFNSNSVNHGASVTAFKESQVTAPNSCQSETRTCNNGVLSGSFEYSSCEQIQDTRFISVWNVAIDEGVSGFNNLKLPLQNDGNYDFQVDWGDGNIQNVKSWDSNNASHSYSNGGVYTVEISGLIDGFSFKTDSIGPDNLNDGDKLIDIKNWGNLKLSDGGKQFAHVDNLVGWTATDILNTSHITNMEYMFYMASSFNHPLDFDTSLVTNMQGMFKYASSFNQPLNFNTSKVKNMMVMFQQATNFNQPLNFDTSSVTTMYDMFREAENFNQPLNFDTSSVTTMYEMFAYANKFNQPLNFDTSKVKNMRYMFYKATSFNSPLDFNTRSVTNMESMFSNAINFNQPLNFDTSKVKNMDWMFSNARKFNQDISNWCIPKISSKPISFDKNSGFSGQNSKQPNWGTCPNPNLDCSSLNGGDWIKVPGNSELGTDDFCVMKFEAKNDGSNNPISKPSGNPWVDISQINAKSECESLGQGYKLISNSQWTTIARNAELVNSNWNSGSVGSGIMFKGHSDSSPDNALSVTNVNNFFDQTGNSGNSEQRRVLTLSNGATIWDLAGNVWEWNSDTCSQGDPWYKSSSWIEWTNSNVNGAEKTLAGAKGNYDSSNGVGKYFGCFTDGAGFRRGGYWRDNVKSGAFALILLDYPTVTGYYLGFRCSYEKQ